MAERDRLEQAIYLAANATTELGVLLSGPLQRSLYERVGGGK